MSTMQQYQAIAKGGPLTLVTVPKPVPGPNDLLIRTKAVGLNPADAKFIYDGTNVSSWPDVVGHEAAGIVESVGEGVTAFQAGDEVFGFASRLNGRRESAACQDFILASQELFAKKPRNLSLEEAASLSVTWTTAAAAIIVGLGIPLPGLGSKKLDVEKSPKSILVVGGSSGCGAHAVQLLRFALGTTATVVATSSPQHHSSLKALGASSCVPRAEQGDVDALKTASPNAAGYDAILDCVGAVAEQPQILGALREDGPKLFSEIFAGAKPEVPEGVKHTVAFLTMTLKSDGGEHTFPYLAALFEEGKLELPVRVEVVGKGYAAIEQGIKKLYKGVSGTKLVVSL